MGNKKIIITSIATIFLGVIFISLAKVELSNLQKLNGEKYITESTSPDKKYTITIYLNNGGATTDFAILGVLKNNKTKISKNIYWQYHCETANIEWLDDKTVKINNVTLDVSKDTYDYRNSN